MNTQHPDWTDGLRIAGPDGSHVEPTSLRLSEHNDRVIVTVPGIDHEVVVFRTDYGPKAIANECLHRGYPLEEATVLGEHDEHHLANSTCIKCPLHGLIVSLDSGLACRTGKGQRIPTYEVHPREGQET